MCTRMKLNVQQRAQQIMQSNLSMGTVEVLEELGCGSYGRVCKIRVSQRLDGQDLLFACKTIQSSSASSWNELLVMQRLYHAPIDTPIVRLKEAWLQESWLHLVIDLCPGGNLLHAMNRRSIDGRLTEGEAALVLHGLVKALQCCHDLGVIHRDVKPENLLLARESDLSSIRLADFGLSRLVDTSRQRLSDEVGTRPYMAPEVLEGDYSLPADVWSAGVLLYEMLSGKLPFYDPEDAKATDVLIAQGKLDMEDDPWHSISTQAKNLIRGLLCRDETKRLSLVAILRHPWMVRALEQQQQRRQPQDQHSLRQEQVLTPACPFVHSSSDDLGKRARARGLPSSSTFAHFVHRALFIA